MATAHVEDYERSKAPVPPVDSEDEEEMDTT